MAGVSRARGRTVGAPVCRRRGADEVRCDANVIGQRAA
jgi:hypothetical protein